jgi:hypothetical protein
MRQITALWTQRSGRGPRRALLMSVWTAGTVPVQSSCQSGLAKVAEYQRRGLVHFHAVIRFDGPDGPTTPPPGWATTDVLDRAVHHAAKR